MENEETWFKNMARRDYLAKRRYFANAINVSICRYLPNSAQMIMEFDALYEEIERNKKELNDDKE